MHQEHYEKIFIPAYYRLLGCDEEQAKEKNNVFLSFIITEAF
jgi:hypothetical protein